MASAAPTTSFSGPAGRERSQPDIRSQVRAAANAIGRDAEATLLVLAAAGSGPVLPVSVAATAITSLGGPPDLAGLRDVLAGFGGLVTRADPGTDREHVGLFHDTLVEHLRHRPPGDISDEAAHEAIVDALYLAEVDPEIAADPNLIDYRSRHGPEHLWAIGRHTDALNLLLNGLGPRPADNLQHDATLVGSRIRSARPRPSRHLVHPRPPGLLDRGGGGRDRRGDRLFGELLADQLRVLGPDHPDTLATRNNLACRPGEAGDAAGALPLLRELLADQLRVLGPDHPDTLTTRNNLACWPGEQGTRPARLGLQELLTDQLRVLGPDHPDTLTTRNNLAVLDAGERGTRPARSGCSRAAHRPPAGARPRPPRHPDHPQQPRLLATGQAGDPAGAIALFERAARRPAAGARAPTTPTP